jgi:hypothetical protein
MSNISFSRFEGLTGQRENGVARRVGFRLVISIGKYFSALETTFALAESEYALTAVRIRPAFISGPGKKLPAQRAQR